MQKEESLTLVSWNGTRREARVRQHVVDNNRTLAVTTQGDLGVGASLDVRVDLGHARGAALLDCGREAIGVGRVELDVLVVAAGDAVARGVDKVLLSTGVSLVPPARKEDVHVGTRSGAGRLALAGSGGGQQGEVEDSGGLGGKHGDYY